MLYREIENKVRTHDGKIEEVLAHVTGGNGMQEHSHVNKTTLDKISEKDGKILFNNLAIEDKETKEKAILTEKEIQNARKDINGKTHTSLNNRMNSDMSYVEDRFNNSSLLSHNDKYITAQKTFDGFTKELKIKGRTIKNLLGDAGSCEDLSKWLVSGPGTVTKETDIKLFGNSSFKFLNARYVYKDILCDQSHKYFISAYVYIDEFTSSYITLSVGNYTEFKDYSVVNFDTTKLKQWQRKSLIVTGKSNGGFRILTPNTTSPQATTYLDGVMVYDLTEIYGAGKEPTDIAQLERELPYVDGITSIGENNNTVEVVSCGKNLLDISKCTYGYRINETKGDRIAKSIVDTTGNGYTDYIKVNTNIINQIQFSCNNKPQYIPWACYDENKIYIKGASGANTGVLPSNAKYIRFTVSSESTNEQLEGGTVATPYEEYKDDKVNITLKNPIRSLPNGVADEVDIENGKVIRRIGKVLLNGSENWSKSSLAVDGYLGFYIVISGLKISTINPSNYLTSNFRVATYSDWSDLKKDEFLEVTTGGSLGIRINSTKIPTQDVSGFKTWLSQNPTTVYYELATPIEETIETTSNSIRTYDDLTNIFLLNNEFDTEISCKIPTGVNEIFDARKSTVKNKTFGTLDDRFEEIEQDMKDSCTDFNGVNHINLPNRLDSDLRYITNRFNNASLLDYEGQYIKAEKSYDGFTKDLKIKGRTLQNLIKISFFNRFDIATNNIKLNGYSGNLDGSIRIPFDKLKLLKGDTYYTFIYKVLKSTTSNELYLFSSDTTVVSETKLLNKTVGTHKILFKTKPTLSDLQTSGFYIHLTGGNTTQDETNEILITDTCILEGDYTNQPIPSYFEGIKSVAEESNKIEVLSTGKNLFDIKKLNKLPSAIKLSDDKLVLTNSYANDIQGLDIADIFKFKPNKKYTISLTTEGVNQPRGVSGRISLFKVDGSGLILNQGGVIGKASTTFISPENINEYTILRIYGNSTSVINIKDIQIEEGIVATEYEPYKEDKISILLDEPLREVPKVVNDEVDLENNKIIRRIGKEILTENSNIKEYPSAPNQVNTMVFVYKLNNAKVNWSYIKSFTDKFNFLLSSNIWNDDNVEGYNIDGNSNIVIRILKSKLTTTDVAGFKAWLKANPATVYYELATPIETPLDLPTSLRTNDNITHIFTQGSLIEPNIQAKIPSNVNAIVSTLKIENKELENELEKTSLMTIENSLDQDLRLTKIELGVM